MRVWSSDEHYNAGAENSYVLLTSELAKVIATRFNSFDEQHEKDKGLVEMNFLSDSDECGFYTYLGFHDDERGFLPGKEVEEHLDKEGWAEIPDNNEFKGDLSRDSFNEVFEVRADGVYMVIGERGVSWEMHPKHSDIKLYSETLPREIIQRVI